MADKSIETSVDRLVAYLKKNGETEVSLLSANLGMIVGGIVGLILVLLAPGLVGFIVSNGQAAGGAVTTPTCNGIGLGGF